MNENCRICRQGELKSFGRVASFEYFECLKCGSFGQYPKPQKTDIENYYTNYVSRKAEESSYLSDDGYQGYANDKILTFRDLELTESFFKDKSVLDVGCGTGHFLRFLQDREYNPENLLGIDISDECIKQAKYNGLNCQNIDFYSLDQPFQIISMWHVIEHVLDPRAYLQHAFNLLTPGGILIIETPVVGMVANGFGEKWRFLMPIEHINLFSRKSLFQLAENIGFKVRKWVTFGSGNDSGSIPDQNKKAMDFVMKQMNCGDTLAVYFEK